MEEQTTIFCKGGGCTAKLGPGVLSHVLERIERGQEDSNLLVGFDSRDDAAVYQVSDEIAIVQTLDFFPPMIEDPYLFGKIAATNALSDIYAMGGEVKTALNIVCFPENMSLNILGEIMRGGSEQVVKAGGILCGGHSIKDEDIKYGLSVNGIVHPKQIYTNNGGQPGDVLILTKRLGVGLICTANRVGQASKEAMDAAIVSMTILNKEAAEISRNYTVHACTDVTGFGLLGHLHEMMDGKLKAVVDTMQLPYFPEAFTYAEDFLLTAAAQRNRDYVGDNVSFQKIPFAMEEILFDPQTAGGLLFAVPQSEAQKMVLDLQNAGLPARTIGRILNQDTRSYQSEITVL